MPTRPPHFCAHPGCGQLVTDGARCPAHAKAQRVHEDSQRDPEVRRLYQSRRWLNASRLFRAQHPLCVHGDGLTEVTDHITPHRGDVALFWDPSNWQPLCKRCHDRKTATEDRVKARQSPPVINNTAFLG